jgi:single-strand DNA-binding protein
MNTRINYVELTGRLGKDVQITTFDNGKKKAAFSMVTTEAYKDYKGQDKEINTWHNIVAWGKIAENMSTLSKGNKVKVVGSINNRSYQDKENVKKYVTEINCSDFSNLAKIEVALTESNN